MVLEVASFSGEEEGEEGERGERRLTGGRPSARAGGPGEVEKEGTYIAMYIYSYIYSYVNIAIYNVRTRLKKGPHFGQLRFKK